MTYYSNKGLWYRQMTQNPNDGKWRAAILKETQEQIWALLFHWAFFIGAREKVLEKGGFHGRDSTSLH